MESKSQNVFTDEQIKKLEDVFTEGIGKIAKTIEEKIDAATTEEEKAEWIARYKKMVTPDMQNKDYLN